MHVPKEREKKLLFTDRFYTTYNTIYAHKDNHNFYKLSDLSNKTIAIPKGYAIQVFLKKYYPEIKQVLVKDQVEALKLLSFAKVDAAIGKKVIMDYLIEDYNIPKVVATAYLKDERIITHLRLGVAKSDSILRDILQKAQKMVTKAEISALKNKWFGVDLINHNTITLTQSEEEYLQKKTKITVCVQKDWWPYTGVKNNQFEGIAADFLNLYARKLAIPLKIIVSNNKTEQIKRLYDKQCDIKPVISGYAKTKLPYLSSQNYFEDTISLVTKIEHPYIKDLTFLNDKKIIILKGSLRLKKFIKNEYPEVNLLEVDNINSALQLVFSEKAFAYIGTSLVSSYYIQKSYSNKLKIVNSFKVIRFGLGILQTEIQLLHIFK